MNLEYYYWYFKSVIPPRICDDIVRYGLQHKDNMGIIGGLGGDRDLQNQPLNKKEKGFQYRLDGRSVDL